MSDNGDEFNYTFLFKINCVIIIGPADIIRRTDWVYKQILMSLDFNKKLNSKFLLNFYCFAYAFF